jgi:hypothetical protein
MQQAVVCADEPFAGSRFAVIFATARKLGAIDAIRRTSGIILKLMNSPCHGPKVACRRCPVGIKNRTVLNDRDVLVGADTTGLPQ